MSNIFKQLFSTKVLYKEELPIAESIVYPIVKNNRKILEEIPDWIDEKSFGDSCFNYGIPPYIRDDINKSLDDELTYTDLMVSLSGEHFKELSYLEIGVSVGKNFYQILRSIQKGNFIGFDIEEINPILAEKLSLISENKWRTPQSSIKKNDSSLKEFVFEEKPVKYLCGDIWDENCWRRLEGNKFNLVFSDALHSAKAILFEFEMLVKYNLLAERFIIFWDDLHGKMKKSFLDIVRKYDQKFHIKEVYLIDINGWIGQHEAKHPVGIISNFILEK